MSRPKPVYIFVFLVGVIAAMGGVAVTNGGFYIAKHEGDTLHLLQIVFRMADGEWPHLDFMTPIGIMAFLPIVAFVKAGFGIGHSILWGQVVVALILLMPVFWVAYSRFNNALAYFFGLTVMVLVLALVYGETDRLVSISMHYNRWAWAVSYLVIVAAVLPGRVAQNGWIDGVVIGLGMAFLLLSKITYFTAFMPGVLVALVLRRAWQSLGAALVAGLVVMAVMTAFAGVGFWAAYLNDLITVSSTDVRPNPGAPLKAVIGAPAYLGGSLACILAIVLLRQAGQATLGLALLVLMPGFFFVTYQNSGNDPQWLPLLAILLLAPQVDPEARNGLGWPLARALAFTAVAALSLGAPSFLNLAYSPFRHATFDTASYQPLVSGLVGHSDLQGRIVRSNRMDAIVALDEPGSGLEYLQETANRKVTEVEFRGERLPQCELNLGLMAWFKATMAELDGTGLTRGKRVYVADLFSSHWLFGDVKRLKGGAPWYYGGLPGFESAEFLMVPLCPAALEIRKLILEAVTERGTELTEIHRGKLFVLYEINQG